MSGKFGTASQVISLPKGGGALHGIGEKFSPDLHTGTGNFSIPIILPPGRNGFQPKIELIYSTGQGNGSFGLGWTLNIPGITRKTSKGIPQYRDHFSNIEEQDTFILSGAEDLVPISDPTQSPTLYRPRTEGLFAQIEHHWAEDDNYWIVKSKDGLTSDYGTPQPPHTGEKWFDPAVIADPNPDLQDHIFSWKLTSTTDPFKNRIEYVYERERNQQDGSHHWDQTYLSEIRYVDYGEQDNPQFLVSVKFVYENRADKFSEYRSGFEIRTVRRCCRVEIYTYADKSRLTRTYHLLYLDQTEAPPDQLPVNGVSLLHQIWVEGHDHTTENLLTNASFESERSPEEYKKEFTGEGAVNSAATNWTLWHNSFFTTRTELVPSNLPFGGSKKIHVDTNGPGCGLVQVFAPTNQGPPHTTASAWVFVKRGKIGIGTGNDGNTDLDVISSTIGRWEFLQAKNGVSPANEFIIYAASPGGAEFYVADTSVSVEPRSEWLPPLEFNYTHFEPQKRKYAPLKGELPAASLGNPNLELVDLFGNGLPDILEMNGTVRYWRNLGMGRFDLPRMMREAPAESFAEAGVQLIDANGDGRSDLLVTRDGRAGYYPLAFGGSWNPKSYQRYKQAPSFNLEDPEVRLVDLDGDGITDALRSATRFECFFNDPEHGWLPENRKFVPRRRLEEFPDVNFSDPRVRWADMTGDGLQDIVLIHNGRIDYWPSLGYGRWGKRITMRRNPRFEDAGIYGAIGYDPKRILLGDVDGDGVADLVYIGSGHITVWINQTGNGWSEPITIHGTPPITDLDAIRLADIYGTGTAGILWTYDYGVHRDSAYKFLDLTGGVKPYLLNGMNNHLGAITKVEYVSSTQFYLQDQKDLRKQWKTPLPFPVQVVSRVEVVDELSQGRLTTEYRYHHGYWDGSEREFRGFGMVEQIDTESFEKQENTSLEGTGIFFRKVDQKYFSPPLLTKTWFHQGPMWNEDGGWSLPDYSKEYWEPDPQILQDADFLKESSAEAFLTQIQEPRVKRDALRALRGSMLRTELYALDGSPPEVEDRPYTVTENAYGLREESKPSDGETDRLHIFFPFKLATRTTQWERGQDPMTQFTFTDDYDDYGQPLRQTQIACPRGWRAPDDKPSAPYLATRTLTVFAKPIPRDPLEGPEVCIYDRVAKTTSYELLNTAGKSLAEIGGLEDTSRDLRVIGQILHFYDELAFFDGPLEELPFGQIGSYGALVRIESLVLTENLLREAYGTSPPPYLSRPGNGTWTEDYPIDFRDPDRLPALAGYIFRSEKLFVSGYFAVTERRRYDFHDAGKEKRGLVTVKRDPLEHDTNIEYDEYRFLPTKVTDSARLTTEAEYDYGVLQPRLVTDPNGNKTAYRFTSLGLLQSIMTWGGTAPAYQGDQIRPSVRMDYDFLAFDHSPQGQRQPISVRTLRQVNHDQDTDVPVPERDATIESCEYSDGFGRLLQTRTQGEKVRFGHAMFGDDVLPADQADELASKQAVIGQANTSFTKPNVIVSGWQRYDNKGRVVEKYEPFFDIGWGYDPRSDTKLGQKVTMFYDPRGRVFRTVNPDGSEQCVVYGRPGSSGTPDLTNPFVFEPTPWESYTYDANDNAGRTHSQSSTGYQNHWNTPSSVEVDALGRTIKTTERNGPDSKADWYITRSTYDIRGNVLTVTDPLGRVAFKHVYDLTNRPWRVDSLDAGVRRTVLDAAGNVVEQRDSKDALILHAYDDLNRPVRLWARNDGNGSVTLREKLVYGDSPDPGLNEDERRAGNLLGKLYQHYDEAGLLTFDAYDFKGNLLEKQRQVIADSTIKSAFNEGAGPARSLIVDWDQRTAIEGDYRTSTTYDALNRVKTLTYPQDVDGQRKILKPYYNHAGALERVTLDGETYVDYIAYNAKGQRTLIAYGNGVMNRYAYDSQTFRLARMCTEKYKKTIPSVNLADPSRGAIASASSTYARENPPSAVIDGNRAGSVWPPYWADNTRDEYPDWIEVQFDGMKTINLIHVFTTQDAPLGGGPAAEPTEDLTFSKFGLRDYEVQYWSGDSWKTVEDGKVTENNKVWRKFPFNDLTTDRIRVLAQRADLGFSRIVEIEAYEASTGLNVALAANGGKAKASSIHEPFPPSMVMDGDRIVYQWLGEAHYPAWLQIDFGGQQTVEEIDLFFHQDENARPWVDPRQNPDMTSRFVITDFEVQYWEDTDWITVPDGNVIGNDKVWRKFTFPAIATDKIRVLIHRAVLGSGPEILYPNIIELEAYGPSGIRLTPQDQTVLQDIVYSYDLAGNILAIQDRTKGSGVRNNPDTLGIADPELASLLVSGDALIRQFTYDPLYRLLSATGRECKDIPFPRPWSDGPLTPRCGYNAGNPGTPTPDNARDSTGTYVEEYGYDPAGNMVVLKHQRNDSAGMGWTRHFGIGGLTSQEWSQEWQAHLNAEEGWPEPPGNRLTHTAFSGIDQPAIMQTHFFDGNGNLIREFTSRHFAWDHADRLIGFADRPNLDADATVEAIYLYDSGGQRVKKLVRKGANDYEVTVYIDGIFEFHRQVTPSEALENNTLHVMDNQSRIALVRVGNAFPKDGAPDKLVQFHLGDHLGSSHIVIGGMKAATANEFMNREEYFPYGETSFGSFAKKRYRFTGKERDEESGLYYHGARYYAPWLVRWISCDPLGRVDGNNLYNYARLDPIASTDSTGRASEKKQSSNLGKVDENASETHRGIANAVREQSGLKPVEYDVQVRLEAEGRVKIPDEMVKVGSNEYHMVEDKARHIDSLRNLTEASRRTDHRQMFKQGEETLKIAEQAGVNVTKETIVQTLVDSDKGITSRSLRAERAQELVKHLKEWQSEVTGPARALREKIGVVTTTLAQKMKASTKLAEKFAARATEVVGKTARVAGKLGNYLGALGDVLEAYTIQEKGYVTSVLGTQGFLIRDTDIKAREGTPVYDLITGMKTGVISAGRVVPSYDPI